MSEQATTLKEKNPLQVFKDKDVNQIGEKLRSYLNKRRIKGKAEYRMLNGTLDKYNPHLTTEEEKLIYPSGTVILMRSTIKDPDTNSPVLIAKVKEFDKVTGDVIPDKIEVHANNRGKIVLIEGNLEHEAIYNVLELLNENASNPFRDTSKKVLFERIDRIKEAEKSVALDDMLYKALEFINVAKDSDNRAIHVAYGGNHDDDPAIVKSNLVRQAKADPETFYKIADNPRTAILATVKKAEEQNIISYDQPQHRYVWNDKTKAPFATLERVEGERAIDQLADFVLTSKDGKAIQTKIETLLKGSK